ncbi:MAG: GTPase ObgE [Cyclobacteriaceae bacterium]
MSSPNFIDYVKLFCKSGDGGAGAAHFRREKHVPKGGPDGGDGGRGGHVILRGNKQMWTLLHLRYRKHIKAVHGESGGRMRSNGKQGEDVILEVPLGTSAKHAETGERLVEITEEGQEVILVEGGMGGQGNDHFKTATNQAPQYAQPGMEGSEDWFILELKVLADVGLVGFPNAGKSTLLSTVSAAKPEIADYPFTTLTPNLGVVSYYNDKSFVMADIPGIIEGASEGKGLGLRFLRHIERNSVLLFMIPADSDDIMKEYEVLLNELRSHNPESMDKKRILSISKSDLLDDELIAEIKQEIPEELNPIFFSSAASIGIQELKDRLWKEMNERA